MFFLKEELQIQQLRFLDKFGQPIELSVQSVINIEKVIDRIFDQKNLAQEISELEDLAPYFAAIWKSAVSLTDYLISNLEKYEDIKIFEIGCGLAIPSLVLAKLGYNVMASDFHPSAVDFLNFNKARNKISKLEFIKFDWRNQINVPNGRNILIASDVLYDKEQPRTLHQFISQALPGGGTAYIADPGRSYLQSFVSSFDTHQFDIETIIAANDVFIIKIVKRTATYGTMV